MLSLQHLFHKEDKLFSLLEASVSQARASVQALVVASRNPGTPVPLQDVAYSRLKDRAITEEISEEIYASLSMSVGRESIERLSNALYKIPKIANKFEERLCVSPEFVRAVDFSAQLGFLDQATDLLVQLVHCLRSLDLEQVKTLGERLQSIEREADKQMPALYKDLYSGKYPAGQVLVLKDLYELLEKLIDRCRTAGKIVVRIALENS